jgi:hypothetical protein
MPVNRMTGCILTLSYVPVMSTKGPSSAVSAPMNPSSTISASGTQTPFRHRRTLTSPPMSSAAKASSLPFGTRVQLANVTAGWTPMATATGSTSPAARASLCMVNVCLPSTSRAATLSGPRTSIRWIDAFSTPP